MQQVHAPRVQSADHIAPMEAAVVHTSHTVTVVTRALTSRIPYPQSPHVIEAQAGSSSKRGGWDFGGIRKAASYAI